MSDQKSKTKKNFSKKSDQPKGKPARGKEPKTEQISSALILASLGSGVDEFVHSTHLGVNGFDVLRTAVDDTNVDFWSGTDIARAAFVVPWCGLDYTEYDLIDLTAEMFDFETEDPKEIEEQLSKKAVPDGVYAVPSVAVAQALTLQVRGAAKPHPAVLEKWREGMPRSAAPVVRYFDEKIPTTVGTKPLDFIAWLSTARKTRALSGSTFAQTSGMLRIAAQFLRLNPGTLMFFNVPGIEPKHLEILKGITVAVVVSNTEPVLEMEGVKPGDSAAIARYVELNQASLTELTQKSGVKLFSSLADAVRSTGRKLASRAATAAGVAAVKTRTEFVDVDSSQLTNTQQEFYQKYVRHLQVDADRRSLLATIRWISSPGERLVVYNEPGETALANTPTYRAIAEAIGGGRLAVSGCFGSKPLARMESLWLIRLSTNKSEVRQLMEDYDKGKRCPRDFGGFDINLLSRVLKESKPTPVTDNQPGGDGAGTNIGGFGLAAVGTGDAVAAATQEDPAATSGTGND